MTSETLQRQSSMYAERLRAETFVAEMGGHASPLASRFAKLALRLMGVLAIASDFHGPGAGGGRGWLMSHHKAMCARVNPEGTYDDLDFAAPSCDLEGPFRLFKNAWLMIHLNDPSFARETLSELVQAGLDGFGVLLDLVSPAGVLVSSAAGPRQALEAVESITIDGVIPAGPPEMAVMAGGLGSNAVRLGRDALGKDPGLRVEGYYNRHEPRRVSFPEDAGLGDLVALLAAPIPDGASLSGRPVIVAGAGALGICVTVPVAIQRGGEVVILDGDVASESNLNRQAAYVGRVHEPKAPVLAEVLAEIDPAGTYEGRCKYVRNPSDLEVDGAAAVISAADNDTCRHICAEAARGANILSAQGGTSEHGGELSVHHATPGEGACLECVIGPPDPHGGGGPGSNRCQPQMVCANMVIGGALVAELKEALQGRRWQNLRFTARRARALGNKLGTRLTDVSDCTHRPQSARAPGPLVG